MITIVYCSTKKNGCLEKQLCQMATKRPEILHMSTKHFAKGYNEALKRAQHDIILFLREDVEVMTKGFDQCLKEEFANTDAAILGVVGSLVIPGSAFLWDVPEQLVGKIAYKIERKVEHHAFSETFSRVIPVLAVHDAFFAVDRSRIQGNFDEGFQQDSFYDVDFFLRHYFAKKHIGVTFKIDILRNKFDQCGKVFEENRQRFIKIHTKLPLREKPHVFHSDEQITLEKQPFISIILPILGESADFLLTLESIEQKTTYQNYEILVAALGLEETEYQQLLFAIEGRKNTRLIGYPHKHLPHVVNDMVVHQLHEASRGILLLEEGIIFANDVVSRLVAVYQKNPRKAGVLGARIHNMNHLVRHMGLKLIATKDGETFELGLGYQGYNSAYQYTEGLKKGILGVSRECFLIDKKLFTKMGGFNEKYLHSLEDFDLSIRCLLAGKENIIVGDAVCMQQKMHQPGFFPEDFETLLSFINENIHAIQPFVEIYQV